MLVGEGILTNTGDLPRDLHARLAAGDLESIAGNLARDVDRREAADAGELITEVAVQHIEFIVSGDSTNEW